MTLYPFILSSKKNKLQNELSIWNEWILIPLYFFLILEVLARIYNKHNKIIKVK